MRQQEVANVEFWAIPSTQRSARTDAVYAARARRSFGLKSGYSVCFRRLSFAGILPLMP